MSNDVGNLRIAGWFRQWQAPLRRFLGSRGAIQASDLDDVAQEVFLRLMRYERAELIEHPQAYLYKMASNVAAEWAIRGRNARPHESKWLAGLSVEEHAEFETQEAEVQRSVEKALLSLESRQREVLRLFYFEGLTRLQIAAKTGTTERSVKRALIKGYEVLRTRLDPDLLRGVADEHP